VDRKINMGTKFTPFIDKLHELVDLFQDEMEILDKTQIDNPQISINNLCVLNKIQYDLRNIIYDIEGVDDELVDHVEKMLGRRLD
jgi:hypothetical protein